MISRIGGMQSRIFRLTNGLLLCTLLLCNIFTTGFVRPTRIVGKTPTRASTSLDIAVVENRRRQGIRLERQNRQRTRNVAQKMILKNEKESPVLLKQEKDDDLDRWTPLSLQSKILLPLQLMFGVYFLLLLPAGLALDQPLFGGASVMGTLRYEYVVFFSLLILPRAYRFGQFAKPSFDTPQDAPTVRSVLEPLSFVIALVGSHWTAAYNHALWWSSEAVAGVDDLFLAPDFFFAVRILSMALVAASGWYLGKSYDRVTDPDDLVKEGPYAVVRHPIYTSYFLLFSSTLLALRSYGALVVLLLVASVFYKNRMDSEDEILAENFGEKFERYKEEVPWSIFPFLY